jgi:hypothetical protein
MTKNLTDIFGEKGIQFFQTDRVPLDHYMYEPFQDNKEVFDESKIFETNNTDVKKLLPYTPSLFNYFLDGSRKPYKIGDMITTDNKFAPVVAGQIGAACCKRVNKKMELFKILRKNLIVVFDSINNDDFQDIKEKIRVIRKFDMELDKYSFDKMKDDAPTNAAIAKIQKRMQDLEVELLNDMVSNDVLSTDNMLVIDGSLQFLSQKFDERIFYNVIGISKSFNPNLTGVLKGKKHIGVLLAKLKFGERTPVYKYESERQLHKIGAWYLRIRDEKKVKNPLDGIIKVEKMAMKEDVDTGFDTSIIDNISSSILGEIWPTCHGKDTRWNNHLYPIYLTEKALKSKFLSDIHFMNLF